MMRDTDNLGPEGSGQTGEGVWPYVGVGCLTAISGMMAFGVIAVLVAKAVGWARGCAADVDTGAPCDWLTYWLRGAIIGMILVPTVVIWRMRKTRSASKNSE
jgi:hypothetical protein